MTQSFFRTRRYIKADNFLSSILFIIISFIILVLWLLWFFCYPVEIYKTSTQAHIEMGISPVTIAAPIDGVIQSIDFELEQTITKNDVLMTLNDQETKLSLKEITALLNKAINEASYAKEEYTRWKKLHASKLLSDIELLKSESKMKELDNAALALEAKKELLELTLKKHKISAPISGTVGSMSDIRPGAVVKQGDKLGSLIPQGNYKIIAFFTPSQAIGKVKANQKARMKLDGFSWTQYGMIHAQVKNVANEVMGEGIKVTFHVLQNKNNRIPYQHGLTGSIEVLVDKQTPAKLVLAKIGKVFTTKSK